MSTRSPSPAARPGEAVYRIYGLVLQSNLAFRNRLIPADLPPHVRLDCSFGPLPLPPAGEVWRSGPPCPGEAAISLHVVDGNAVLRFSDISTFTLTPGLIECRVSDPAKTYLAEIQLLGMVLALWLELNGAPALHASAVVSGGRAAAFVGGKGAGKTAMAAAFLELGAGLLTEDLLALEPGPEEVICHAGYPQMRMWPAEVARFARQATGLEVVHPAFDKLRLPVGVGGLGRFSPDSQRLGALYVLARGATDGRVRITPLSQQEATIELIRHSFVPQQVQALGLGASRLALLAQVAAGVPLFRLEFRSGFEQLPEVLTGVAQSLALAG